MLDKIMYKNKNEITLIFTNRTPVSITSSAGNAVQLYLWLITPTKASLTLPEFESALESEDTVSVRLENAS